jgi:hypothetical protein
MKSVPTRARVFIVLSIVTNIEPPGRVYLFVLDDLHVQSNRTPAVKRIAHDFIEKNFAPNDMAATTRDRRRICRERRADSAIC